MQLFNGLLKGSDRGRRPFALVRVVGSEYDLRSPVEPDFGKAPCARWLTVAGICRVALFWTTIGSLDISSNATIVEAEGIKSAFVDTRSGSVRSIS